MDMVVKGWGVGWPGVAQGYIREYISSRGGQGCGVPIVHLDRRLCSKLYPTEKKSFLTAVLLLLMASFTLIAHWFACVFYAIAYVERPYLAEPKYGWLDVLGRTIGQPFLPNKSGKV